MLTATVSAFSLAEMTGIPRETARRKLTLLAKIGLVKKESNGSYRLTMNSGQIHEFIRESGFSPLVNMFGFNRGQSKHQTFI